MIDRARLEGWSHAALRIVAGFAFSLHGVQKLFGAFTTRPGPEIWSQGWFGGVIELACGVMIALGLVTRAAAFIASGTMAVAYIQFHWKGQIGEGLLPIVNGGELALVYCFLFLWLAVRGAGSFSIDRLLARE